MHSLFIEATEELKCLKRENARLKQERDILKKAAAYFATEIS
jgi:transposase-like protein